MVGLELYWVLLEKEVLLRVLFVLLLRVLTDSECSSSTPSTVVTSEPEPSASNDVHERSLGGINILPSEVLRQIIIYLIHDPSRPIAFSKSALLPLASASKALRAVSTEFLYGSMDLFEASFGLRHRVLPSNTILAFFYDLIHPQVTSFIRSGVRRLLIRDRDRKALLELEGQHHLSGILNRVENLRSIHFDGHFYRPLPIHVEFEIFPISRLNDTLVNLTFLNCDPLSPIFPCFLAPGRWTNLTRIHYRPVESLCYPSPFAPLQSLTDPVFPHLSTFVLIHCFTDLTDFTSIFGFLTLQRNSLQRLSLSFFGDYNRTNISINMFQIGETVYYDDAERKAAEAREECMRALWAGLPALHRLRLLDLDIGMTKKNYAPKKVVHIPSLRGVNLHNENAWQYLQSYPQNEPNVHPVCIPFTYFDLRELYMNRD